MVSEIYALSYRHGWAGYPYPSREGKLSKKTSMCALLRKSTKNVLLKTNKTVHHSIHIFMTYHPQQTDIKNILSFKRYIRKT